MTRPGTRLFFDMDGTLYRWRNIILNIKESEEITDIDKLVQETIYDILYQSKYYESLPPHQNIVDAFRMLLKDPDMEVFVLSCALKDKMTKNGFVSPELQKMYALHRDIPELDDDHIIIVPDGDDKRKYVPGGLRETDILIDDCTERNLRPWVMGKDTDPEDQIHGKAIKVLNGVNNTKGTWKGSTVNYLSSPEEIVNVIREVARTTRVVRGPAPGRATHAYDPITETDYEDPLEASFRIWTETDGLPFPDEDDLRELKDMMTKYDMYADQVYELYKDGFREDMER